jgi:RNA polymerase sigma-70 factor (ECF subfamily)
MSESSTMRPGLLNRLPDVSDDRAWSDFVDHFAPKVYGMARRHGLQDADAADVMQDVLRAMVHAVPRFSYDPARGSFRAWLCTVARNQLRKFFLANKRRPRWTGGADDLLQQHAAPEDPSATEQQRKTRLFELAAALVRQRFRPSTWEAFWRSAVGGENAHRVGESLGMSVGAVYIARTRVLARIRQEIRRLQVEEALDSA